MGFFAKKQETSNAILSQLNRIADSLEQYNQSGKDNTDKVIVEQLYKIAENFEEKGSKLEEKTYQEMLAQLGKAVELLSCPKSEVSEEDKIEQATQLERIANALESGVQKGKVYSDVDKIKAAYALNLCLVSISQIIDYGDQYILEQEYEGILNNLNLEHMPKDEALLDILRQILDTITFFRIQEEEKQFIEQEYQDRMKAAIWSAVPSCGAILACPDPKVMLITLVTQVGSGYMNYRNEKAKAGRDKEKSIWELQKAAIEQFNGLRRELFTTAWRLADTYGFKDEMRLTESQISQYNRILQESNLYRRLARLEDIQDKFGAFPPFWYAMGNTALQLFESDPKDLSMSIKARNAYAKYFEINNDESNLLRTDTTFAACALEYVSLMDSNEKDIKMQYINKAIKHAGTHYDIVQLCAMALLDIGEIEKAAKIIKTLVCEGYNESVNAQLLSMLYIKEYFNNDCDRSYENSYLQLTKITNTDKLIEWPEGTTIEKQYNRFVYNNRVSFLKDYAAFFSNYYSQKAKVFQNNISFKEKDVESSFVMFAKQLEKEIASFPGAEIPSNRFSELMKEKKNIIDDAVKNSKLVSGKNFDDIFADVFFESAQNIAEIPLNTMEDITKAVKDLETAVSSYIIKQDEQKEIREEYTFDSLYGKNIVTSDTFNKVKAIFPGEKLLKEKSKHIEILSSGSVEYYRYIKDHKLNEKEIVAVINDKTIEDCDLLITETGILVHRAQSKTSKGIRRFVLYTGLGAVPMLISEGINHLYNNSNDYVPYVNIEYSADKFINPKYSNKYVDMTVLSNFIDECKKTLKGGTAYKISEKIMESSSSISEDTMDDVSNSSNFSSNYTGFVLHDLSEIQDNREPHFYMKVVEANQNGMDGSTIIGYVKSGSVKIDDIVQIYREDKLIGSAKVTDIRHNGKDIDTAKKDDVIQMTVALENICEIKIGDFLEKYSYNEESQ